ncbi:hypothetical protein RhiirC2_799370 [Rhizophagus irregularis]|uniref:NYN domain-containing protein n=1 Tax=Rhizophagus irregularis TaxID=588596 RepID=A0A2N1M587_9GLOM|nr:hypothetical protein RhiirC2_799370 [Rhizophagus irregularis]
MSTCKDLLYQNLQSPKHSSMRDKPLEYLKITSALLPPSQPPPDECLPMLYLSNKKFAVTKCQLCLISFFHIKAGPSHTRISQSELAYIFIDNSNFFLTTIQRNEGKYNNITYDYGSLINILKENHEFGSFDVKVFDRNIINHKKGVNNFFTLKIAEVIFQESPNILVLVTSDGDYHNRISSTFKDKKNIILKLLDDHYKSFAYGYKAYSTNNIIKFDIKNINTIQNQIRKVE